MTSDTPTYWATAQAARFIPAADYVRRTQLLRHQPDDAQVSRCTQCGQWTWDAVCPLHPDARQDTY